MTKVEKHAQICKELNELYARKNADYGDSFGKSFQEYGMLMPCLRLEDKLNRIKSLSKQAAQVSDESIVDTLMDLANYSIMTLVELGQGEPEKDPEKILRGTHEEKCLCEHPSCLCNTCGRDHDSGDGHDHVCCVEHGRTVCHMGHCPDYVKEG